MKALRDIAPYAELDSLARLHAGAGVHVLPAVYQGIHAVANRLMLLLTDRAVREQYFQSGRSRAQLFPWATVAGETMAILDREAVPADKV